MRYELLLLAVDPGPRRVRPARIRGKRGVPGYVDVARLPAKSVGAAFLR